MSQYDISITWDVSVQQYSKSGPTIRKGKGDPRGGYWSHRLSQATTDPPIIQKPDVRIEKEDNPIILKITSEQHLLKPTIIQHKPGLESSEKTPTKAYKVFESEDNPAILKTTSQQIVLKPPSSKHQPRIKTRLITMRSKLDYVEFVLL